MESNLVQRPPIIPQLQWIGIRVNDETLRAIHRAMLLAALVGLFASFYLLLTYISGKPIACGLSSGCEIVRASTWAYTFGIPRPALGVLFYLGVVFLLTTHAYAPQFHHRQFRRALLLVAAIGFIESAFLTFVQWLDIKAFCIWCLVSAVAATIIFLLSWIDGSEPPAKAVILRELKFIFHACTIAVVLGSVALWFLLGNAVAGR